METLLSISGILGAACCVGMYAGVSWGKISADKPAFFIVNGLGAVLILIGASHQFDIGDTGTVGQELIWAGISFAGAVRAWMREGVLSKLSEWKQSASQTIFTGLYR
ncbi:MAG: hypothetical protein HC869_03450 [Rhodospirillales bacterium]|nr:hypothetical protein [Rhodospirillales bacterium]